MLLAAAAATASQATAADYIPFDQTVRPGRTARTFAISNATLAGYVQPVRWIAPGDLLVQPYAASTGIQTVLSEDEAIGLEVGHVHRFRLTNVANQRGIDFYPSVEMIDRLHPPAERAAEFPVLLELTDRDFEAAASGQLVTKVVYVQPRNATYIDPILTELPATRIDVDQNVMAEAVLRGRPIAIVRLGTRAPLPGEPATFFGSGGRLVAPLPQGGLLQSDARVSCDPSCPSKPLPTGPELYPDEYICDGGDTGVKTAAPIDSPLEIGFEETVGSFLDDEGVVRTRPSTRVCVYSPTFGHVAVGTGGRVDTAVTKPAGAYDGRRVGDFAIDQTPILSDAATADGQVRMRSRLSGLSGEARDTLAANSTYAGIQAKVVGSFEEYGFNAARAGLQIDQAIIGERIAAAIEWSENRSPIALALDEGANQVVATVVGAEYTHYEDRRPPGELVLAKTADKRAAQVGETVRFAIRYDNVGDKPLREVTVTDHLSPRLRYVADSAASTRDAQVSIDEDGVGSVLIQIRLNKPLPAGEGGLITFETIVR